jgi:hypothetical protein
MKDAMSLSNGNMRQNASYLKGVRRIRSAPCLLLEEVTAFLPVSRHFMISMSRGGIHVSSTWMPVG